MAVRGKVASTATKAASALSRLGAAVPRPQFHRRGHGRKSHHRRNGGSRYLHRRCPCHRQRAASGLPAAPTLLQILAASRQQPSSQGDGQKRSFRLVLSRAANRRDRCGRWDRIARASQPRFPFTRLVEIALSRQGHGIGIGPMVTMPGPGPANGAGYGAGLPGYDAPSRDFFRPWQSHERWPAMPPPRHWCLGRIGHSVGKPKAIVMISAHWYVPETAVTAMAAPRTIHDFGGFPEELYRMQYPAPGDSALAQRVRQMLAPLDVRLDQDWGLDHGTWSVLYAWLRCRCAGGSAEPGCVKARRFSSCIGPKACGPARRQHPDRRKRQSGPQSARLCLRRDGTRSL